MGVNITPSIEHIVDRAKQCVYVLSLSNHAIITWEKIPGSPRLVMFTFWSRRAWEQSSGSGPTLTLSSTANGQYQSCINCQALDNIHVWQILQHLLWGLGHCLGHWVECSPSLVGYGRVKVMARCVIWYTFQLTHDVVKTPSYTQMDTWFWFETTQALCILTDKEVCACVTI